jgi:hypothetical protein
MNDEAILSVARNSTTGLGDLWLGKKKRGQVSASGPLAEEHKPAGILAELYAEPAKPVR